MQKTLTILFIAGFFAHCAKMGPIVSTPTSGEFVLLTYNVAGLPEGISPSNPEKNTPLMSPLLNKYDIALVQEDFVYHEQLKSKAQHSYQSEPNNGPGQFEFGDGLNRFSFFPFTVLRREAWSVCSNETGNDCLAKKGFSVAETAIAPGVVVDVYNLHLDSGHSQEDIDARNGQIQQLLAMIHSRSDGKPLIIAGDTNLDTDNREQDGQLLHSLLTHAGLTDVCRSLSCGRESVDRVLFRSSDSVDLKPTSWAIDSEFVDEQGHKLSDHFAIRVSFNWAHR